MDNECPKCKGTGIEFLVIDGLNYSRPCDCGAHERQVVKDKLQFANIPDVFKDNAFNNFERGKYEDAETIEKATRSVYYYYTHLDEMLEKGMGLYIYSKTKGSGKTRLVTTLANEIIKNKGISVKFCSSVRIIEEIKATWDKEYNYSEFKLIEDFQNCPILIIDDFGTEQVKDWVEQRFYSILNSRYAHNKVTIFTSNYPMSELPYDDRITSRIMEKVYSVKMPEESIRKLVSKENVLF